MARAAGRLQGDGGEINDSTILCRRKNAGNNEFVRQGYSLIVNVAQKMVGYAPTPKITNNGSNSSTIKGQLCKNNLRSALPSA
jgi:hypothetical protein